MATFYHRNRNTPGVTLTITGLEYLSSKRVTTKPQFLDVMADGTIKHQSLGTEIQKIIINIENLSLSNRNSLIYFIETTCGWGAESFDFDDDQGNEYSNCVFVRNQHSFTQTRVLNYFDDILEMIVGPAVASTSPSTSPSATPSATPSSSPSVSPSVSPSNTPSVSPSVSPSASPSASASPSISPSTSPSASASPSVSVSPSSTPSVSPSSTPSVSPSVSPSASPSGAVSEDLTTFTEVDPNGHITVTSSKSTFADLPKSDTAYVYKDFGASHFGDFEIRATINCTSSSSGSVEQTTVLGLSNTVDDLAGWGNGIYVSFYEVSGSNVNIYLVEWGTTTDKYVGSINTPYYIIFDRIGTTARLRIYSDAAHTTLLDTLSITVASTSYRYFYVTCSSGQASSVTMDGYTENVDIISP